MCSADGWPLSTAKLPAGAVRCVEGGLAPAQTGELGHWDTVVPGHHLGHPALTLSHYWPAEESNR